MSQLLAKNLASPSMLQSEMAGPLRIVSGKLFRNTFEILLVFVAILSIF